MILLILNITQKKITIALILKGIFQYESRISMACSSKVFREKISRKSKHPKRSQSNPWIQLLDTKSFIFMNVLARNDCFENVLLIIQGQV